MKQQRKVEARIRINAPVSKVLDAFTEPEPLSEWWGVERSHVEKRPGGAYALVWEITNEGMRYVSSGIVNRYVAGSVLEVGNMSYFNPEREILTGLSMRISVEQDAGSSLLRVVQEGYGEGGDWDWYYQAVQEAWPSGLKHLKKYLENH